jgi:hypothetical protein|uniref:hypothetical protein n=1 Tax=Cephaloticoccus sp. TaxID=1985742 RepID=UPI0040490061
MKLTKLFGIAALIGIGIFTTAVLFGTHATDSFALATIGLVLVGFVRDYTPRRTGWEPRNRPVPFPVRQTAGALKLAA